MLDLETGSDPIHDVQRIGALAQHQPVDRPAHPGGDRDQDHSHHGRGREQGQRTLGRQPCQCGGQPTHHQSDHDGEGHIEEGATQGELDPEKAVAEHTDRHRDRNQRVGQQEQDLRGVERRGDQHRDHADQPEQLLAFGGAGPPGPHERAHDAARGGGDQQDGCRQPQHVRRPHRCRPRQPCPSHGVVESAAA